MEVLLTTLFAAAAACAILYFAALDRSGALDPLRYFTLVPVTLAAYRRRGLLPGQAMAAFFSSIFLWELAWGWHDQGFTAGDGRAGPGRHLPAPGRVRGGGRRRFDPRPRDAGRRGARVGGAADPHREPGPGGRVSSGRRPAT